MTERRSDKPVRDIGERTVDYSLRAIRLYGALVKNRNGAGRVIAEQYLRAATSVGANVAEAKAAESRPDFVHKYGIAQKELRECLYWLSLLDRSGLVTTRRLAPLLEETKELAAIVGAIIVKSKKNAQA